MEDYFTIREIANTLGVPIETIRVRFHRAHRLGYKIPQSRFRVVNGRKVKEYKLEEFLNLMDLFDSYRNGSFYQIWKKRRGL